MLDIDHFKAINDSMGHLEGDRILTEFVRHINNVLRRGDLMGRFGGEEFVVLLPETAGDVAKMAAGRVRTAVPQAKAIGSMLLRGKSESNPRQ